jgi:hypothetical protein
MIGGNAVVPGSPSTSNTYIYVANGSMPKGGTALTAGNIELISQWISAGAPNSTAAVAAKAETLNVEPSLTIQSISQQVAGAQFSINVVANYSMTLDDLAWRSDSSGSSFEPMSAAQSYTLSEDGKSLTIQVTAGSTGGHTFEVEDTSFAPSPVSDAAVYSVVAPKAASRAKLTPQ